MIKRINKKITIKLVKSNTHASIFNHREIFPAKTT